MRRIVWLLLALLTTATQAGRLTTFAWDSDPSWPPGTTIELCGTGDVCATGIVGTQHALDLPVDPGDVISGRARAVPPEGYQCGNPPALCQPSPWATVAATWPANQVGLWATHMQLINIDFSGTITGDFNGATSVGNYTGGDLQFSGEGFVLAKQSVGTVNKWMRFRLVGASNALFFALGDSSGNLIGWNLTLSGGNLVISDYTDYSTYNSWNNDTYLGLSSGAMTAGQFVGITFEPAANRLRVWSNVTNVAPSAIDLWDSAAADGISTAVTFKPNSAYVGFGCWTSSGSGVGAVDDFTSGDFSGAASQYNHTASGGLASGGTSAIKRTQTITASGGLASGGTSAIKRTWNYFADSGITVGGIAGLKQTQTATALGGLTINGTAAFHKGSAYLATGGIITAGMAGVSLQSSSQNSHVANGGLAAGGTAALRFLLDHRASGGVALDGTAAISYASLAMLLPSGVPAIERTTLLTEVVRATLLPRVERM